MKKRNFITGFSAAFVSTMALLSCGGIRSKENVVLTINGKEYTAAELFGDQKTAASAEAKFNAVYKAAIRTYFASGNEGESYMSDITRDTKNKVAGAKAEAQSNADKNGTKYATEWEKILSTNGVDDEAGLYDKFEYDLQKEKFEDKFYDYKFAKTSEGYETNYDILRNGGYFRDKSGKIIDTDASGEKLTSLEGYFKEKQPYHIKHILVKLSKAKQNGDDNNCTITSAEADKLYKIIKNLADGKTFEQVSDDYGGDDETAQKNHASLGIMSRDTSFVNDFKLGVYLYEAMYGSSTNTTEGTYESTKARTRLFETDFSTAPTEGTAAWYANQIALMKDPTNSDATPTRSAETYTGIGQIPYGEVEMLKPVSQGGVGDLDSSNTDEVNRLKLLGVDLTKIKEKYLPRNVIFNKYFNKHNIMVITPTKNQKDGNYGTGEKYMKESSTSGVYVRNTTADSDDFLTTVDESATGYASYAGFNRKYNKNDDVVKINNTSSTATANQNKVLRDENGRVILVFRSGNGSSSSSNDSTSTYQGIHFVVIERSPFINQEDDRTIEEKAAGESEKLTTLNEYYTQYYPWQTEGDHPTYSGVKTKEDWKKTYTHYITYEKKLDTLKSRSDTVKSELKKADDNLNTFVYDYMLAKGSIKFTSTAKELKIDEDINKWITNTKRGKTAEQKEKTWNETWEKYYKNLQSRNQNREHKDGYVSQLIPEFVVQALTGTTTSYKATDSSGSGTVTVTLADMFKEGGVFNA